MCFARLFISNWGAFSNKNNFIIKTSLVKLKPRDQLNPPIIKSKLLSGLRPAEAGHPGCWSCPAAWDRSCLHFGSRQIRHPFSFRNLEQMFQRDRCGRWEKNVADVSETEELKSWLSISRE